MKKTISLLSAILLGLSTVPMTVSAEDSEPVVYEIGDVTHDGVIDAIDATLVLRYYTLRISYDPATGELPEEINNPCFDHISENADINGDGIIDGIDAITILKIYTDRVSKITTYEMGDVNHDGMIDPVDACLVISYYADYISDIDGKPNDRLNHPYYQYISEYADINNDGIIDGTDAIAILKIYEERSGDVGKKYIADEYLEEHGYVFD
ncbi:MAG: dockerin type I domain-containing protein [Ruminococcus flavefaciens]|nr:dockerin type I domain-containing protein [Ruminococcus flavefaciens]MCM1061281.1 dockerin type I domain-containing protein [Eubacterium sp.]